jgi:predicted phosphodiesterase
MIKADNIIVFGDIHGSFKNIIKFYKKYDIRNSVFISVGDFGVGFEKDKESEVKMLKYYNNSFSNKNNFIFAVRGNHDNPFYYNINLKVGHIELIPDYNVLNINGYNFLFIGGAISVDRKPNPYMRDMYGKIYKGRIINKNYWENEAVVFKPEILETLKNIDFVITHTAPSFCYPQQYGGIEKWLKTDSTLLNDIHNERIVMTDIFNILKKNNNIKKWFYGHYHDTYKEIVYGTEFVLLNIDEFFEIKNF